MTRHVASYMTREVASAKPSDPLYAAVEVMAERRLRHVLVKEGDELVGILSNRDVVRAVMLHPERGLDLHGTTIAEVMTVAPLETTSPSTSLGSAAEAMLSRHINALPVLEGAEVVGILTSEDILSAVARAEATPPRADI